MNDHNDDDFVLRGPKCTYGLPGKIAKRLYPHQLEGLKWLWNLHCEGTGGILGDDMGLGKTMQICSFIAGLYYSNLTRRILIVVPRTLLDHWIKELSNVGLSEKTKEFSSTCTQTRFCKLQDVLQDGGILLTTYDIVRSNAKLLSRTGTWDYMFLDEGHLIKNPITQRAKRLHHILCPHRIMITGTPLQNNLKELWALFHFCCPGLLGSKNEFIRTYDWHISRGNEKNAFEEEKQVGSSASKDLRDRIQPHFLRRMKNEVFRGDSSLPKKSEIAVWLQLTPYQRQLYETFLNELHCIKVFHPFTAIQIMKTICNYPHLLVKRGDEDLMGWMSTVIDHKDCHPPIRRSTLSKCSQIEFPSVVYSSVLLKKKMEKEDENVWEGMDPYVDEEYDYIANNFAMQEPHVVERFFDIAEKHIICCKIPFILSLLGYLIPNGHKVLIFSQTRMMLDCIQESLITNDFKYMRMDGETEFCDRDKIVKDFQEGRGAPILILTSKVGGLGLNLTIADRVIVADPAWNPSVDNQCVDRAYRIGQKKDVIVYRLMTCGTLEDIIYRKQIFKGGLFKSATEHQDPIRYFSKREESLRSHVEFLKTLNIAGISHHTLLFSKTTTPLVVHSNEKLRSVGERVDREVNFDDVKSCQFHLNRESDGKINGTNRLSRIFANKVTRDKEKTTDLRQQSSSPQPRTLGSYLKEKLLILDRWKLKRIMSKK